MEVRLLAHYFHQQQVLQLKLKLEVMLEQLSLLSLDVLHLELDSLVVELQMLVSFRLPCLLLVPFVLPFWHQI